MGGISTQKMINRIWELLEPDIKAYGNLIDRLLHTCDETDLMDIVKELEEEA